MLTQQPPETYLTLWLRTGTTGYIGGDALYALEKAHPEYEYSVLVRSSDKGAPIAAAYPRIRLVYGTLDDSNVIEEESARADVVLRKIFAFPYCSRY
jgi:N-acetyl-gamma-glutamylphosphate reductase